jgi:hypothetical protein
MAIMSGRQAIMEIFQPKAHISLAIPAPWNWDLSHIQDYPQLQTSCACTKVAMGAAHMYANASGKTGVVNLHGARWATHWACCTTPQWARCRYRDGWPAG